MAEERRKRTLEEKIKEATKITLEGSSIHSIPNITRTRYKSLKIIWLLCFLTSSSLCAWYLVDSIQDYLKYETVTNIKIRQVNQLPLPVVSICKRTSNKNGFNKSVDLKQAIPDCKFQAINCDYENDFEYYEDFFFGTCVRYNSGRSLMGKI